MTDKNPSIGIVIVNYNGAKYQNAAIKTIKEQTYQNYQIVVVDSASTDDSVELLVEAYVRMSLCWNSLLPGTRS